MVGPGGAKNAIKRTDDISDDTQRLLYRCDLKTCLALWAQKV